MSLFGEIVEPGTRTTWEDWDDESIENNIPELKWPNNFEIPDTIDLFLMFDGKSISEAIKIYSQDAVDLVATVKEASLHLYRVKLRNVFICVIKDYSLLLTSEIVELLRDIIIKSEDVLVLVNKPLVEYQTNSALCASSIVRSLCTTQVPKNSYNLNFARLEQPNIVSGVAAGVLTLREHLDLSAKVIVYYLNYSENSQLTGLQELLHNFGISFTSNTVPSSINDSNLYI